MHSLCIAAALTFSALPDGAPEFLAPEFDLEEVEATNTPGSAEWYLPVERLKLPVTWRITRNGRAVTNSQGRTRISLAPTTGLWPNDRWHGLTVRDWYCGYDVGNADYVRLPGESDPDPQYFNLDSPEMFNLTWYTHVGSTNYRYSALACSNDDYYVANLYSGRELFKPQASRFDSVARSALLGSYEAYYERLYYASQGQRNEWEVDDWGEIDDPQRFNFNPTNDLVATTPRFHPDYPTNDFESAGDGPLRPIPASRRLTDADNIASLIGHVRSLFTPKLKVSPVDDEPPPFAILNARQFVFRPHWLTDPRDYPRGDAYGANLWWASTIPPPASTQLVWKTSSEKIMSTTLGLFPWIEEFTPVAELYALGVPFSCYATTLDMLASGDGFSASGWSMYNPCYELIGAIKWHDFPEVYQDSWQFDEIDSFNPHGMTVPMFLTNAYPRAAASVPKRSDAYSRYVDVGTDTDVVRRMVPGRLDLVNQLMSVMDRTIMIPSMHITSTNTRTKAENVGVYTGDTVTVSATWNGTDWEVTGLEEEFDLSGTPQMDVSTTNEVVNGIRLDVSATSTVKSGGSYRHNRRGLIYLTEDWMQNELQRPATNRDVTFSSVLRGVGVRSEGEWIGYIGIDDGDMYDPVTFQVMPSARITRKYEYSEAESSGRIGVALGPHQPGVGSADRVDGCQYAILDALATETPGYPSRWRSMLGEYGAGELAGILNGHAAECRTKLRGDAASLRPGYTAPEDYIPLPSSIKLVCLGGPTVDGTLEVYPTPRPERREVTNIVYHFVLPVPGERVGATHYGMLETNVWIHVYGWEVHVNHVFDTNWVETVTSVTNLVDDYFAPGEYSEYNDGGTVIDWIDGPVPPEVEMVFTNSYPSEVEQTGTAVTNWTSTVYFDLYETVQNAYEIIESWRYEADHTRDWTDDPYYEIEEHDEHFPGGDLTTNYVTTVELTVTNSLPDGAIREWTETHTDWDMAELVLVTTEDGGNFVYIVRHNYFTGEETWEPVGPPYLAGEFAYEIGIRFDGEIDADLEPDHEAFDESLFFRVMTQVDWLWNYMKLEKEEQ